MQKLLYLPCEFCHAAAVWLAVAVLTHSTGVMIKLCNLLVSQYCIQIQAFVYVKKLVDCSTIINLQY